MPSSRGETAFERVYVLVRQIPPGRVMTYGQIAQAIGGLSARAVGWAMRACPRDVPWQRVVNAQGCCSLDRVGDNRGLQQALLEAEGVVFDDAGKLSLTSFRFEPRPVRRKKSP